MMWKSLQMPRSFQKVETGEDGRYAKFVVEALERGWGITLGNALRRTLLSSLQGAAIVSVKIEGVEKEFSTIPGVKEDVTDIILNLKSIRVKLLSDHDETLHLDVSGDGEVTAKSFMENPGVVVLTPDVHIATLNGNASLSMDVKISSGRGFVRADELKDKDAPIGVIATDANFNPVQKVAMHISDTRVGQKTDYNRLELEITTDGSIDPEDALAYAAKLLVDHLEIFINFEGDLVKVLKARTKNTSASRNCSALASMNWNSLFAPATACVWPTSIRSVNLCATRKTICSNTRTSVGSPWWNLTRC